MSNVNLEFRSAIHNPAGLSNSQGRVRTADILTLQDGWVRTIVSDADLVSAWMPKFAKQIAAGNLIEQTLAKPATGEVTGTMFRRADGINNSFHFVLDTTKYTVTEVKWTPVVDKAGVPVMAADGKPQMQGVRFVNAASLEM